MLKTLQLLLFILLLSIFTGCASKIPFAKKEPLRNNSLLYIYAPNQLTDDSDVDLYAKYRVKIGNENIDGYLCDGEYVSFDIKPSNSVVQVTKESIFTHTIKLSLKKNSTYYLKVSKISDSNDFSFEKIDDEHSFFSIEANI